MASSAASLLVQFKLALSNHQALGDDFQPFITTFINAKDDVEKASILEQHMGLQTAAAQSPELVHPGEYSGRSVLLELIVEAMSHVVHKGFPYHEIYHFLHLYVNVLELLRESSGVSITLPDFVKHFKDLSVTYSSKLSKANLLVAVKFITQTTLQHFHLYQFLLTQQQLACSELLKLDLYTFELEPPLPLKDGLPEEEWIKREKLRKLEEEYEQQEREYEQSCSEALDKAECKLSEMYQEHLHETGTESKMTIDKASTIIDSLTQAYIDSTLVAVSQDMRKYSLDMRLKVQKMELLSPSHNRSPSLTN